MASFCSFGDGMKLPVTIWLVVLLLGLYGTYSFWIATETRHWSGAAWGLLAISGCVGLITRKRWSQHFVYLLSLLLVINWAYAVWQVAIRGWPHPDTLTTVFSLLPGIFLVLVCAGCSLAVFRYFHE